MIWCVIVCYGRIWYAMLWSPWYGVPGSVYLSEVGVEDGVYDGVEGGVEVSKPGDEREYLEY